MLSVKSSPVEPQILWSEQAWAQWDPDRDRSNGSPRDRLVVRLPAPAFELSLLEDELLNWVCPQDGAVSVQDCLEERLTQAQFRSLCESVHAPMPPMWTAATGCAFCASIHEVAFAAGWNVHLGGGTLTRGSSNHDLDVLLMPRSQVTEHPRLPLEKRMRDLGYVCRVEGHVLANGVAHPYDHPVTGAVVELILVHAR